MLIFISYARKDKLLCDAMIQELQVIGDIEVFIDTSQPALGTPLPDRIKEQISSCDLFVVLLTESGLASPWVTTEIAWATSIGKYVIPVLQEGRNLSEVPSLRADLEYVKYNPADYDKSLKQLGDFIEKIVKQKSRKQESDNKVIVNHRKDTPLSMERLDSEDILNLLLLRSADLAPSLEQRLIQNAKSTVADFFIDPRYSTLTNLGTLATDASVGMCQ